MAASTRGREQAIYDYLPYAHVYNLVSKQRQKSIQSGPLRRIAAWTLHDVMAMLKNRKKIAVFDDANVQQ
jgi:hypothetical protein